MSFAWRMCRSCRGSAGIKRNAAEFLQRELVRRNDERNRPARLKDAGADMLFVDYLRMWLKTKKNDLERITYQSYEGSIEGRINAYFSARGRKLSTLESCDFEDFYDSMYEDGLSGTTAQYFHRIMKQALNYAVKRDILLYNIMDKVDAPRRSKHVASYYTREEALQLFEIAKGDPIYLPILLATYYGLRRSEVMGLRWRSIDFTENRISIEHKVLQEKKNGKTVVRGSDNMKTISSRRSMPLIPSVAQELKKEKARQAENRRLFPKSYSKDRNGYICVDALGKLYRPNFVSAHFSFLLEKHGLRHIRFHELRHTCASLLAASGVPMKLIQLWLGHSNYTTTADIYSHLDYKAQEQSASMIESILG